MNTIIPDILRAVVSEVMLLLLMFTLSKPKYGKKVMTIAIIAMALLDLFISIYFYLRNDYTSLAKFDIGLVIFICIIGKPLVKDSIMEWCFNFITAMNVFLAVVVLSYLFSRYFPYPPYANSVLRFFLFGLVILLVRRYIHRLYRQTVERWNIFFLVVTALLINFFYYIVISENIQKTLRERSVPLFLLIVLGVVVYITIFYSIQSISSEYKLREENIKIQMQQKLIRMSMDAMETQVELTQNEYRLALSNVEQVRRLRHDLKHHLSVISALLVKNDTEGALDYIGTINEELPQKNLSDKNLITESFMSKYSTLCERDGIVFKADIDYDEDRIPNKTKLGLILGNALQNAYEAALTAGEDNRQISVAGRQVHDNLLLVISNGYDGKLNPDYKTRKDGNLHGFGILSIQSTAEQYGGYVEIEHTNREFMLTVGLTINNT